MNGLHGERTPEEIEQEIELTRERMGRDLDALGEKLSPHNLRRQAKDAIGSGIVELVRRHPLPLAAAGLGAAWLLSQGYRRAPVRPRRQSTLPVAAGAAILGFCVGLLVSSAKGERGWLRPTGGNLVDRTKSVAKDLREEAPSIAPAIKDAASTVDAQVKRAAGRVKDGARRATKKK
jgi:hypothetical protein